MKVSPRQIEWLRAIDSHIGAWGCSPTIRELCEAMGIRSTNGASDQLRVLVRRGLLDRGLVEGGDKGKARRPMTLTQRGRAAIGGARPYTLAEWDGCTDPDFDRMRASLALLDSLRKAKP